MELKAFFLPAASGQRFCLHYVPDPDIRCRGAIIHVPPFAEELNRSRRMVALQARAFTRAGYAVFQMDLHGCGDSSGDFGDATWESWVADVVAACAWVRAQHELPLCLWGLRAGSLLAAEVSQREDIDRLLFWQPVVSGAQWLTQFLRLRVAGEMLSGEVKGIMGGLRDDLANGRSVEIAGYMLSSSLARRLAASELTLPARPVQACWIEMLSRPDAGASPVALQYRERWAGAGHRVQLRTVQGPAFWQTLDDVECPELIDVSVAALEAMEVS